MPQRDFHSLRLQAGISLEDLSEKLGYSERQVRRWDNGEQPAREAALQLLRSMVQGGANVAPIPPRFTFIDLFAGIGGLRRGFDSIGGHCVFTSEWNKYAQQTYATNFRDNHPLNGDITKVDTSS